MAFVQVFNERIMFDCSDDIEKYKCETCHSFQSNLMASLKDHIRDDHRNGNSEERDPLSLEDEAKFRFYGDFLYFKKRRSKRTSRSRIPPEVNSLPSLANLVRIVHIPESAPKKKKRRCRVTDAVRRKQLREASARYAKKHPEVHRAAAARYAKRNPQVHRAAVARYARKNPEVNRAAVRRYTAKRQMARLAKMAELGEMGGAMWRSPE